MPAPRWLARFNLHMTNRLLGPLARHLPGMGVVLHIGRKTRRQYRTPVLVFRRGNQLIIALTYGRESQSVRNGSDAWKLIEKSACRCSRLTYVFGQAPQMPSISARLQETFNILRNCRASTASQLPFAPYSGSMGSLTAAPHTLLWLVIDGRSGSVPAICFQLADLFTR
jgi:hypothetical protein